MFVQHKNIFYKTAFTEEVRRISLAQDKEIFDVNGWTVRLFYETQGRSPELPSLGEGQQYKETVYPLVGHPILYECYTDEKNQNLHVSWRSHQVRGIVYHGMTDKGRGKIIIKLCRQQCKDNHSYRRPQLSQEAVKKLMKRIVADIWHLYYGGPKPSIETNDSSNSHRRTAPHIQKNCEACALGKCMNMKRYRTLPTIVLDHEPKLGLEKAMNELKIC